MPLGRFGVRNEYGLGGKELYKDGVESEDPKAVLDGVAVAGLVGLLRQLGDLSQFAAEVFHGLQEQLASTSSRSRKLVTRIQQVEASLPSLEKAMLSQTSHIQFAYAPGTEWHPRIRKEQNHFICNDLPHFIMDSYEECHEPPRLQSLDKFDIRGSGSCLKRYTDPTFFRKASTSSEDRYREKSQQERKARKIKRRRSRQLSGRLPKSVHNVDNNGSAPISSQTGRGESSLSHTSSSFDRTFTSDIRDQSNSHNSKESSGFVGPLSHPSISLQTDQMKNKEFVSNLDEITMETSQKNHFIGQTDQAGLSVDDTARRLSNVTWDEKLEVMEHMDLNNGIDVNGQLSPETKYYLHEQELKPDDVNSVNHVDDFSEHGSFSKSITDQHCIDAIVNVKLIEPTKLHYQYEHQEDDLSEIGSSQESNIRSFRHEKGLSEHGSIAESNAGKDRGTDDIRELDELTFDLHEHDLRPINSETLPQLPSFTEVEKCSHEQSLVIAAPESSPQVTRFDKDGNFRNLIANGNFVNDRFDIKLRIGDIQYMLETIDNSRAITVDANQVGISSTPVENLSEGENICGSIVDGNCVSEGRTIKTVDANQVGISSPPVENLSEGENIRGSIVDGNCVSEFDGMLGVGDVQYMLETNVDNAENDGVVETFTEGVNNENVIEWHHHEDIDSETDNFVDALYDIGSESESDVEAYTKKEVKSLSSVCKQDENTSTDLMADKVNHSEMENLEDGVYDGSEKPTVPLLLDNLEFQESPQSSKRSEVATGNEKDALSHSSDEMYRQSASSLSNGTQGADICDNADEIKLQPAVHVPVESSPQVSSHHETSCTPLVSEDMSLGSINSYPPALWTNGTLFGLQPSKPTVISRSNSASAAPLSSSNRDAVDQCSPRVNGPAGAMLSSVKNTCRDDNLGSDSQDVGSLNHISKGVLDKKSNKSLHDDESNINDYAVTCDLGNGHVTGHKTTVTNTGEDRSSILSLLGRNLLKNGLRRSASLGYEDKSKPSNPLATHTFDNRCPEAVSDFVPQTNLNKKLESPVHSPPPSPPLEYMKISFCPIDGFETSRLKLKYPDGIDHHELTVETFPSFQLVPEITNLQHDVAYDSDNDTFCRSYPCISDYSMSHRSDTDSEQWESGESSESNDHDIYNGLHRISSLNSASSSSRFDETDPKLDSMLGPASELPTLDMKNKLGYEEMKVCLNTEEDSPPLPPLQWHISRQMSHVAQEKTDSQFLDVPVKQNKVGEPKVDDRKESCHRDNARNVDDQGDFLHQIRTKSFNLKRTDAARTCSTPDPATSNQVTAILQKANAIRQAVGSDGEDDSCWSDT